MTSAEICDWYFAHLQPLNIFTGVIALAIAFIRYKGEESYALDSIAKGLTFSSLPSGVAFIWCAAFPDYVPRLTDVSIAFFSGGAVLVLMPFIDVKKLLQTAP